MKTRSAAVQGALALIGLVAAYVTWQRPDRDIGSDVVVLELGKNDIQSVRYDDPRRTIQLVHDEDGYWVQQTEKPPKPAPPAPAKETASTGADGGTTLTAAAQATDGGTAVAAAATSPAPPTPAEPVKPKMREYRANDSADKLVERFTPFMAVRNLGKLPDAKMKELGFEGTERQIELVTSKGTHRFLVASDNLGSTPYVEDTETGRVYVVKSTLVSDLEFASSRLVDRKLHTFRDDEFDGISIESGGKTRNLVRAGDKLADSAQATPDELASNWHERIWRMIGMDVLGRGEVPAAGNPEVKVRVDYTDGGKPVGFIELATAGKDVFARTEHTAGWVRLHSGAEQIVDEAAKVIEPK